MRLKAILERSTTLREAHRLVTDSAGLVRHQGHIAGFEYCSLPVFRIKRDGVSRVVRASRYALALSLSGEELAPDVMALHECDNTVCVRVVAAHDILWGVPAHLVGGDQRANMTRMARMRRGGGRRAIIARGAGVAARAERSRAIREAVKHGWDQERAAAALLGTTQPTLW